MFPEIIGNMDDIFLYEINENEKIEKNKIKI